MSRIHPRREEADPVTASATVDGVVIATVVIGRTVTIVRKAPHWEQPVVDARVYPTRDRALSVADAFVN